MRYNKGFTLIELLVVIAIIGILASVVLASLSSARNKGANSAVQTNLANTRVQAELFYSSNNFSYSGTANLCVIGNMAGGTTATNGTIKGIYEIVLAAAQVSGLNIITSNGTGTLLTATCNTNGSIWATEAPLKSAIGTSVMWCVDSTGKSTGEATTIGAGYVCA